MKPTLLICWGFGWAASSPLAYTLQRNAKYCHVGHTKQLYYLGRTVRETDPLDDFKTRVVNNTWENYDSDVGHKMNLPEDLEPLKNFPLDVFEDFATKPYTIEKYINYYLALWETVKPFGFKAVADFSRFSWRTNNIKDIASIEWNKLHEHFDLKGIFIVRDPIRRVFSEILTLNHFARKNNEEEIVNDELPEWMVDYVTCFDNARMIIPNTQMFVMEELWEGSGRELKKLSTFLDHPIDELWHNSYAPDVGHHIKYDSRVPCQHLGQSNRVLSPYIYANWLDACRPVYDSWRKRYGILPRYWGRPIDYKKNL